jgi:uncharacterized protein
LKVVVLYTDTAWATNEKPLKTTIFRIIFILLLPLTSQATVVKHMFEVSLPVVSQDKGIRKAAFEQGFIEVLARVSGSSIAAAQIDVHNAFRYVQQYRYRLLDKPVQKPATPESLNIPVAKFNLWVQFNQGLIKKLLRENGLSIWGQERPTVLLWLAVRDGGSRYILKQSDQSDIKQAVEKEAKRRGLPVVWPKFDQIDRQNVMFADVWGNFWDPVIKASERYKADAVMVGRMNWLNNSWQVDWSLQLNKKQDSWKLKALGLQVLMASGIDVATDQIASRFAVLEDMGNDGELIVQINDINHVRGYARISHYLASLAPVKSVFATQVLKDSVRFQIEMIGDQDDLKRIIALGKTLRLEKNPTLEVPVTTDTESQETKVVKNILTYSLNLN